MEADSDKLGSLGCRRARFKTDQRNITLKKGSKIIVRMLHCTSPQSLVDLNLLVAEKAQRAAQEEEGLRKKGGGPSSQ